MARKAAETTEISIPTLRRASIRLRIIGTTPLFQNRMSAKFKQTMLVPPGRKTKADRATTMKHDPMREYQDSAEILPDGPTALGIRVVAIKAAMAKAALETPGLSMASAQRLLFMPGDFFPLYGTPQLRMDVTRSADIAKTPDIRTRAFLPKWGAEVEIQYIIPQLSLQAVVNLLCNAGVLIGVGDFRQEKGKGAFGSFRVITATEPDDEWDDLIANHGRDVQEPALIEPEYANKDTEDLMAFYESEVSRRAA